MLPTDPDKRTVITTLIDGLVRSKKINMRSTVAASSTRP